MSSRLCIVIFEHGRFVHIWDRISFCRRYTHSVVNVCGTGARMFLVSAVQLALVELVGTGWAAYCWRRLLTIRSSGPHAVVAGGVERQFSKR
jgi:hypothetical protein